MRTSTILAAGAVVVLSVTTGVVATQRDHGTARAQPLQVTIPAPVRATSTSTPPAEVLPSPETHGVPVAAKPKLDPCAANSEAKQVLVSLADQHLWLCAWHTAYRDFAVTTGRTGDATPTGVYEVQARTRDTTLQPDSGGAFPVKYWIPFKWGMFGFHDAPWQTIPFGSPQYRTGGSHGCVHMRTADVAAVFGWVTLGTPVRVVRSLPTDRPSR